MLIGLVCTLLVLTTAAVSAFGQPQKPDPTFDCANASGQVETLICKDAGLATLDRRMAEVYAAAMKTWPADIAATQRAYQRGWMEPGTQGTWRSPDNVTRNGNLYLSLEIDGGIYMFKQTGRAESIGQRKAISVVPSFRAYPL